MQGENLRKRLLTVCYVLCLLALGYVVLRILSYIQTAVLMLAGSVLLSYLLRPAVKFFNRPVTLLIPRRLLLHGAQWRNRDNYFQIPLLRRGLPWIASIAVVYAILTMVICLVVSFLVPLAVHEFHHFQEVYPSFKQQIVDDIHAAESWLKGHVPTESVDATQNFFDQAGDEVSTWALGSLHQIAPLMTRVVGIFVVILLVPILTFYILLDMDNLAEGFMRLFPVGRREDARELAGKIDEVIGQYIIGQSCVAIIVGCFISIVLRVLGLPYAVLIGLFAGCINLIPYVGTPFGMIPAFLVATFMPVHGGILKGLITLFAMYCIFITEGKVIVPTVVGKSVGLPPIIIISSLIVGAELLGIPGMLLAVPTAAIIRVTLLHFVEKREELENISPHHFIGGRGSLDPEFLAKEMQQH